MEDQRIGSHGVVATRSRLDGQPTALLAAIGVTEQRAGRGGVVAARQRERLILALELLEGTAVLSSLEAHYGQLAPLGVERYAAIIDAATVAGALDIARL